jgi:hypothetical protein
MNRSRRFPFPRFIGVAVVLSFGAACTFSPGPPGSASLTGNGKTAGSAGSAGIVLTGAGGGSSGGGPVPCTGLCKRQTTCPNGGTTSVSGVVLAPTPAVYGTPDPIFNAVVYVPNSKVEAFAPGVSCDRCGAALSGTPLVSVLTGPDGKFKLTNIPTGANVPLVIQIGRWRRQLVIPQVAACADTALGADQTRLPRTKSEGDIPLMAMVTGDVDTLECVLLKIGIDQSEFTTPAGNGRVNIFTANGADVGQGTPMDTDVTGNPATLDNYDLALLACEGKPIRKDQAIQQNIIDFANKGGRVFDTHYEYTYLYDAAPFSMTANWNVDQKHPPDPLTGLIDTSFPKGQSFSQWLQLVGASTIPGQITINVSRHDLDAVVAPSQRWIYSTGPDTIQHYTFNTPVGTAPEQQCGKVLFSDFHVNDIKSASGSTFPTECTPGPLTAQEKVLEFMLFDLSSCVQQDNKPPIVP